MYSCVGTGQRETETERERERERDKRDERSERPSAPIGTYDEKIQRENGADSLTRTSLHVYPMAFRTPSTIFGCVYRDSSILRVERVKKYRQLQRCIRLG